MNPSQRSRNPHQPAWQRLAGRWGWMFGRQSRVEREAAMAEFAEMPEELRQFVAAECAFAQVQATEELRATMLQIAKVALRGSARDDRMGADGDDDDADGDAESADDDAESADGDAESADGDADGDAESADGDAESADGEPKGGR